jgi:cobyrinic acid a,c-diamide synthase
VAAQRAFLPGAAGRPPELRKEGPLVLVAAGHGFTAWSRDCIDVLKAAGATVRRLDLATDGTMPERTAGVVIAGHLWPDALGDLASNFPLMRHLRVRLAEGLPCLALGGGMLYLLRKLQDPYGRAHKLAGVLPAEGELIGELDEPVYLKLRAERESVILRTGEELKGWMTSDAEIMETPVSRNYPVSVQGAGWSGPRFEGVAAGSLLGSRVLIHLSSLPNLAGRFLAACEAYASA